MLSGGRDSVCLLDMAVALCGAERVRALHVNYGLRAESDDDERHCRELCGRLGVAIEVVHASREESATGNLHAWARELRYAAARKLAQRLDRALIATGHTATDQVETILYRLAASPGRRALLGMAASEGVLVRPLLGLTRQDTAAYCTELKLAWHEDSSNESQLYARARVRHGLVKALDAVHPAAQTNVLAHRHALARGDGAARRVGGRRAWGAREHRDRASEAAGARIAAARGHSPSRAGKRRVCSRRPVSVSARFLRSARAAVERSCTSAASPAL